MRSRVLELARGEKRAGRGVGERVERESVDFREAGAQERAGQVFEAFEFGLEDYEGEGGFRIRAGGAVFYERDLSGGEMIFQSVDRIAVAWGKWKNCALTC